MKFLGSIKDLKTQNSNSDVVFNVWEKDGTTFNTAETEDELKRLIAENLELSPKELDDLLDSVDSHTDLISDRAAQVGQSKSAERQPRRLVISFNDGPQMGTNYRSNRPTGKVSNRHSTIPLQYITTKLNTPNTFFRLN